MISKIKNEKTAKDVTSVSRHQSHVVCNTNLFIFFLIIFIRPAIGFTAIAHIKVQSSILHKKSLILKAKDCRVVNKMLYLMDLRSVGSLGPLSSIAKDPRCILLNCCSTHKSKSYILRVSMQVWRRTSRKGTMRQKMRQMSIIFMYEVGGRMLLN